MKEQLGRLHLFTLGLLLLLLGWIGTTAAAEEATMKLYVTAGCGSCRQLMQAESTSIERLQAAGELRVVDVTDHLTDLPAYPALVDGQRVIVGTGISEYLRSKR